MSKYLITGGNRLYGKVKVQRAKNSVLTLIAASILVKGEVKIIDCPKINDVFTMVKILKRIGATASFDNSDLCIDCTNIYSSKLPDRHSGEVRASFFTVGALLSRFKTGSVMRPGGCNIGARPIDIHIEGLLALGASYGEENCRLDFYAPALKGKAFRLRYPSVGATENLIMAATLSEGVTVLENCAREPEIEDLQNFLNACGAKISGAGTPRVTIVGVKDLHGGVEFLPIADRIEAGTFLLAALNCGGEIELNNIYHKNILSLIQKFHNNTCKIHIKNDNIIIMGIGRTMPFGRVVTAPYPNFPTDLQPQLTAVAASAEGKTVVTETVFDDRFGFTDELKRMGADITVNGNTAVIFGRPLHGAEVFAKDLRGGAALTLAGLKAEGETLLHGVEHLERGYEDFVGKLVSLGANIKRI